MRTGGRSKSGWWRHQLDVSRLIVVNLSWSTTGIAFSYDLTTPSESLSCMHWLTCPRALPPYKKMLFGFPSRVGPVRVRVLHLNAGFFLISFLTLYSKVSVQVYSSSSIYAILIHCSIRSTLGYLSSLPESFLLFWVNFQWTDLLNNWLRLIGKNLLCFPDLRSRVAAI